MQDPHACYSVAELQIAGVWVHVCGTLHAKPLLQLLKPVVILQIKPEMLSALNLGPAVMSPSRTNGFLNMLESMRKRTVMLTEQLPQFPSLRITGDAITPQGSFAEAQAQYLAPDAAQVDALVKVCSAAAVVMLHVASILSSPCKFSVYCSCVILYMQTLHCVCLSVLHCTELLSP